MILIRAVWLTFSLAMSRVGTSADQVEFAARDDGKQRLALARGHRADHRRGARDQPGHRRLHLHGAAFGQRRAAPASAPPSRYRRHRPGFPRPSAPAAPGAPRSPRAAITMPETSTIASKAGLRRLQHGDGRALGRASASSAAREGDAAARQSRAAATRAGQLARKDGARGKGASAIPGLFDGDIGIRSQALMKVGCQ